MTKIEIQNTLLSIDNAKNMTKELIKKVQSTVNFIESQMIVLGVSTLLSNKYTLDSLYVSGSDDISLYLHIPCTEYRNEFTVRLCSDQISSTRELSLLYGNYSAKYYKPNRQDILKFIADVPQLLEELASYEKDVHSSIFNNLLEVITASKIAA